MNKCSLKIGLDYDFYSQKNNIWIIIFVRMIYFVALAHNKIM